MFAGHFGLAAGVKALDSRLLAQSRATAGAAERTLPAGASAGVPLWALMLATQLLDVLFAFLLIPHVESFSGGSGYGEGVINAHYTHSLAGALLIALAAGVGAWRLWGRQGGLIIAATVFSHWLLDLVVHRPDLPLLPGNAGNFPLLGFGLWNEPAISITIEAVLIGAGAILYVASLLSGVRAAAKTGSQRAARGRALVAGGVTSALLVLALVTSALGIG
jgi:membrane-bound metal-dependent hydrolase YbcI (DUF457 family)